MRKLGILLIIISLSCLVLAQSSKTNFKNRDDRKIAINSAVSDEKEEFQKALNEADAGKRVKALQKFIENFPDSDKKDRALGLIVSGRAETADLLLRDNDKEAGVKLFKLAVKETPSPVSDELFSRVLMQIPTNLFWRGERAAAFEVSGMIEEKIDGNAKQLIGLSTFYISIENAKDAIRLLDESIRKEPESSIAYQTLGLAHRLNFDLESSTAAYTKALELDSHSIIAKRRLAEMKRATGKASEAHKLYQEILEGNVSDANAKTGLILAMFDLGNIVEAELEMNKALVDNPNDLHLIVGAAYFFAANGDGEKAVELSQKALAIEPRYVWSYIALARGLLIQEKPLEAERVLLTAQKFGNFPTLYYEIATTRLAAGFYKEATEELNKGFQLSEGKLKTKLGGRRENEADNFTELIALERQASIFQSKAADVPESAERLKELFDLSQKIENPEADELAVIESVDRFTDGDDKMKTHRQIFAANQLLEKRKALSKVLELTKDAVKGVDNALIVASPASAILADEIYESRKIAASRGEALIVPDIPKQTLSSILRGRIEEISGWALFNQGKYDEATVRMKRAISVLPKDSAWLRSSSWRLGTILEAEGKNEDALDHYIKGFLAEDQDEVKRIVIEGVYKKIHGNLDGLKERLEAKPKDSDPSAIFVKKDDAKEKDKKETSTEIPPFNPLKKDTEVEDSVKIPEDVKITIPPDNTENSMENSPDGTAEIKKSAANKNDISSDDLDHIIFKEDKRVGKGKAKNSEKKAERKKETGTKKESDSKDKQAKTEKKESDVGAIVIEKPLADKTESDDFPDDSNETVQTRPRIIANEDIEKNDENAPACRILLSQDSVTIINNGGSWGLLVGVEKESLNTDIKATSSSPEDVEVIFEPEIGAVAGRAFFVITSITTKKGDFTINFDTPCGKTEVTVKVR